MGLGIKTLAQFHMRMCSTRPRYQHNSFQFFLAYLLSLGSLSDKEVDSMKNLFEEGEDDLILRRLKNAIGM